MPRPWTISLLRSQVDYSGPSEARKIKADGRITGEIRGEVGKAEDGVLIIKRIHIELPCDRNDRLTSRVFKQRIADGFPGGYCADQLPEAHARYQRELRTFRISCPHRATEIGSLLFFIPRGSSLCNLFPVCESY